MNRKDLINSLVNRKLTSSKKGKPFCICMAGPSKQAPKK